MGYPIYHSQYTAAQIEASIGKTPRIKSSTRTWEIWDIATSAYVDTGVSIDTQLYVDPTLTESGYAADAKVTGDKIGELKNAIFDFQTVQKTASKNSEVFTTYASNGYVSYTDGHFVSDSDWRALILTFQENSTVSIVKNDASGLCGAVVYSEELETIPTGSSAASAYYVKGGRSDKTDKPLPTAENPWTITAGQMLVVFLRVNPYTENDFIMTYSTKETFLNNNVNFNTNQVQDIRDISSPKKPIIKYLSTVDSAIGTAIGKEQLSIFLPTVSGFIKYAFVRCESDARNANIWRIDMAYACDNELSVLSPITKSGEWETAIEIVDAPDFTGGIAHGDEVYTAFTVLVDGKYVQDLSNISQQIFDEVRLIETSLLYNPNDGATLSTREQFTPFATHGKEYIVSVNGIRLKQEITINTAVTLGKSYMAMLPILRGNDTAYAEQITDHYCADNNYIVYDVSVGESGNSGYGWKSNVTMATIWGEESGICASVEMLKQPDVNNAGARMFQVQDTINQYNKLYWSICGVNNNPYSASVNDRFATDTLYKIDIKTE